jgi:hypothetical protein
MEQMPRWCWISVVCFGRFVALKFGDEEFQFVFRQVTQIALRQPGTAVLKFGIFGENFAQTARSLEVPHVIGRRARRARVYCETARLWLERRVGLPRGTVWWTSKFRAIHMSEHHRRGFDLLTDV